MSSRRTNAVRIIGGAWRGRKLRFPDAAGLRPTPDRVRETLINWLRPVLPGARCLDLFAGSGVLGLEALSHGAAAAVLVERDPRVAVQLRESIAMLNASAQARVVQTEALAYLRAGPGHAPGFDVAFLDPPYRLGILEECCTLLEQQGWLAPRAYVYLESDSHSKLPSLPPGWRMLRSQTAGQVAYGLALRENP